MKTPLGLLKSLATRGLSYVKHWKSYSTFHRRATEHPGSAGPPAGPTLTIHVAGEFAYTIEDAGIRAGELTGYRCWYAHDDRLFSIFMDTYEWFPDKPASGDVYLPGQGIHAFKSPEKAKEYVESDLIGLSKLTRSVVPLGMTVFSEERWGTLVTGTVTLWGDVIEHEHGYRAEFGKIASLDTDNKKLLQRFGVQPQESYDAWRRRFRELLEN